MPPQVRGINPFENLARRVRLNLGLEPPDFKMNVEETTPETQARIDEQRRLVGEPDEGPKGWGIQKYHLFVGPLQTPINTETFGQRTLRHGEELAKGQFWKKELGEPLKESAPEIAGNVAMLAARDPFLGSVAGGLARAATTGAISAFDNYASNAPNATEKTVSDMQNAFDWKSVMAGGVGHRGDSGGMSEAGSVKYPFRFGPTETVPLGSTIHGTHRTWEPNAIERVERGHFDPSRRNTGDWLGHMRGGHQAVDPSYAFGGGASSSTAKEMRPDVDLLFDIFTPSTGEDWARFYSVANPDQKVKILKAWKEHHQEMKTLRAKAAGEIYEVVDSMQNRVVSGGIATKKDAEEIAAERQATNGRHFKVRQSTDPHFRNLTSEELKILAGEIPSKAQQKATHISHHRSHYGSTQGVIGDILDAETPEELEKLRRTGYSAVKYADLQSSSARERAIAFANTEDLRDKYGNVLGRGIVPPHRVEGAIPLAGSPEQRGQIIVRSEGGDLSSYGPNVQYSRRMSRGAPPSENDPAFSWQEGIQAPSIQRAQDLEDKLRPIDEEIAQVNRAARGEPEPLPDVEIPYELTSKYQEPPPFNYEKPGAAPAPVRPRSNYAPVSSLANSVITPSNYQSHVEGLYPGNSHMVPIHMAMENKFPGLTESEVSTLVQAGHNQHDFRNTFDAAEAASDINNAGESSVTFKSPPQNIKDMYPNSPTDVGLHMAFKKKFVTLTDAEIKPLVDEGLDPDDFSGGGEAKTHSAAYTKLSETNKWIDEGYSAAEAKTMLDAGHKVGDFANQEEMLNAFNTVHQPTKFQQVESHLDRSFSDGLDFRAAHDKLVKENPQLADALDPEGWEKAVESWNAKEKAAKNLDGTWKYKDSEGTPYKGDPRELIDKMVEGGADIMDISKELESAIGEDIGAGSSKLLPNDIHKYMIDAFEKKHEIGKYAKPKSPTQAQSLTNYEGMSNVYAKDMSYDEISHLAQSGYKVSDFKNVDEAIAKYNELAKGVNKKPHEVAVKSAASNAKDALYQLKDKYPEVAENLAKHSGTEMGSIESHTLDVIKEWEKQISPDELKAIGKNWGIGDIQTVLDLALPLHDIGKANAIEVGGKHLQHEHTIPIMDKILKAEGISEDERNLAKELFNHDLLGNLMNPQGTPTTGAAVRDALIAKANKLGMNPADFAKLQLAVYHADAGAYPFIQQFMQKKAGGGWSFEHSPKMKPIVDLANQGGVKDITELGGKSSGAVTVHPNDVAKQAWEKLFGGDKEKASSGSFYGPEDFSDLTRIGAPRGSNKGGRYKDINGNEFYVKQYLNPEQHHNEQLTNEIYNDLGLHAPYVDIGKMKDGSLAGRTKWQKGMKQVGTNVTPDQATQILKGFAADYFLANYDAVGLVGDNISTSQMGTIKRMDNGGALKFRAQGKVKDADFFKGIDDLSKWTDSNSGPLGEYSKVFKKAGISDWKKIPHIRNYIDDVLSIRPEGGWHEYVQSRIPDAPTSYKLEVSQMLEKRTEMMKAMKQMVK